MIPDKSIADFQDELTDDLLALKSVLLRCESSAKAVFEATQGIQIKYKSWTEPTHTHGTVSLFTTQRQLMLLVDKLQAINASFVYGDLAQLIDESHTDRIPF